MVESAACCSRPILKLKMVKIHWFLWWTSEWRDNHTWANFGKQHWRWSPCPPCVYSKRPPCVDSKTSPCVPAPREHVSTHVRVVPAYTVTFWMHTRRRFWVDTRSFHGATQTHTTTNDNTTTTTTQHHNTQHHTETETERDRDRQKQRVTEKDRQDKTRQEDESSLLTQWVVVHGRSSLMESRVWVVSVSVCEKKEKRREKMKGEMQEKINEER